MLDVVTAASLDPWELLGLERHWLETVGARATAPVLLIYSLAGRLISVGRYHLYGGAPEREGIGAMRRLSGGRVLGAGEGWLGIALVLPTRTALLPERDAHIRPEQSMNRYSRGVLGGLRALGIDGFYPGRDAITFKQRELAMCTMEQDASGAMLFEAIVAVNRGMEEVVHDLERLDPPGSLPCPLYTPDSATRLVRELDRDLSFGEVAAALKEGYRELLGEIRDRQLDPAELTHAAHRGRALLSSGWLALSAGPADFNRAARAATQLGAMEAKLSVTGDNKIERALISGDLIANSSGLADFERELVGRPHDLTAVSQAVMRTYGDGRNFILGIGELANLARLITRAQ
ncbi:MAG TPA: hypothetical protein VEJ86_01415 [Candidatus Binataceae bacterium]|nr:hypothetical protein [Candidatus Binataceae bacterium]